MVEHFYSESGKLIAITIKNNDYDKPGKCFFSPPEEPLQLGINVYSSGGNVPAHYHNKRNISVDSIQEIVHIVKGMASVALYDENQSFLNEFELDCGDTIFFLSGGHGIKFSEDTKIIEVKQGPYLGKDIDKTAI